jgi:oxygen-independent coproporphyrinogen-3 oxidase
MDAVSFSIPTAAYIHIPFCRRRCYYCDFPVSIVGDRLRGETSGTIAQYVDWLCQEIVNTPAAGAPLETVFFGGGTPSLLSVAQLHQILTTLDRQFGITSTAELSMEMDPGTFDQAHLQGYHQAGINRVSLGVQSFQTDQLLASGRTHTHEDIFTAVDLLHQVNVINFSLDLISGLPDQTQTQWQANLEAAIAIAPPHLSIYDLTIEPVTAFGRWYQAGQAPLPSDDDTAQMYRLAQQILTAAGYDHYEISNYAQPGYQCRHNRVYWENRSYYGFGMGAASYVNGQRFTRPRKRQDYFAWVQHWIATGGQLDWPVTPPHEALLDTLMLGLRLAEGLSLDQVRDRFGREVVQLILVSVQPYIEKGWVEIVDQPVRSPLPFMTSPNSIPIEQRLKLGDPEGFLFSNVVLSTLFEVLGNLPED